MELHDGGRALLEAGGDVGVEARPQVQVAHEQVPHGALHTAPEMGDSLLEARLIFCEAGLKWKLAKIAFVRRDETNLLIRQNLAS